MALNSYSAILAALAAGKGQTIEFGKSTFTTTANKPHTLWGATGMPGIGSYAGSASTSTAADGNTGGAMRFVNPGGGDILNLTGLGAVSNGTATPSCHLLLVDRLLYYPGITPSGALQSLTASATIPRYTTGAGTVAWCEVVGGTLTIASTTFTMTYTNQAGTGSRVSPSISVDSNPIVGRIPFAHGFFIPFQAGDTGVRSIESITFGAAGSVNTVTMVIGRVLARVPIFTQGAFVERDLVLQTPRFPEIKNDACLQFLVMAGQSSTGLVSGNVDAVAG